MQRRAYVAGLAAGLSGLAGCGESGGDGRTGTPSKEPTGGPTPTGEVDLPLDKSALVRGAAKDAIPAITEPAYGPDWSTATLDERLGAGDRVIGVERDGRARAYPLRVLTYHEIVNDAFGGPLLVTFCPLCGSSVTAERRVDGEVATFGVSGYLWRSDLVMYDDATDSLWSQILATAVRGPQTGTTLDLAPSQLLRWDDWRASHPNTEVLLPPPDSATISGGHPGSYANNPYPGYDESTQIGIGANTFEDARLHPKTQVMGLTEGNDSVAYALPRVEAAGVVNDAVGDRPVVVASLPGGTLVAYNRRIDGRALTFTRVDERTIAGGGSTWDLASGRARSGPHEGRTLEQANDRSPMFWFAWVDFYPETRLFGE